MWWRVSEKCSVCVIANERERERERERAGEIERERERLERETPVESHLRRRSIAEDGEIFRVFEDSNEKRHHVTTVIFHRAANEY